MTDVKKSFCNMPPERVRPLPASTDPNRARLIIALGNKWVNGTTLRFCFLQKAGWKAKNDKQPETVRKAFAAWKELGIGLEFQEVSDPAEAEIRIGFEQGDGAWSYIGRDILEQGTSERTMNFGWDIANDLDTALHEIGHTLGFPHEHQNPFSGIVWDEEAVYASLAQPPNSWSRATTFHNIIRKLEASSVRGSKWDPDSVMHYPFEAGLIKEPAGYTGGLRPKGGLSAIDKEYVKQFYPDTSGAPQLLKPFESVRLDLQPGQQANFRIEPAETRYYDLQSFGQSDTVLVLFEDVGGDLRYVSGDDDGGEDRNAKLRLRLKRGSKYVARLRLYYAHTQGNFALMLS